RRPLRPARHLCRRSGSHARFRGRLADAADPGRTRARPAARGAALSQDHRTIGRLIMRNWLLLSTLGLLAITSAPLAQPTAKLDGSWRALTAERDGKPAPDVIGHRLTF